MPVPVPARREVLLDAADRSVQRAGPAVSMASIAAEAGITKPILYRHFGDKGGLYAALAERYTDRLLATLQAALAAGGTARERVVRTVGAYLRTIEAEPQVYRFLLHSAETASPAARGLVQTFLRRLSDLLALGIGSELRLPPGSVRAQVWAHAMVGMVQAAGDWWITGGDCSREVLVGELVALLEGAYPEAVAAARADAAVGTASRRGDS